ncbi:glycosyl hydrolase [Marisediminicola senii]|uniref:glycosyl hydrolase n=1 Tax=Marisediminicola senii TaxID=2711233 RepID=UPI0013EC004F|nr:glycosyl hydrolase [Marisediminicola senii]
MGKFRQRASASAIAIGTAVAVALTGATPAIAVAVDDPSVINIADTNASAETNSLFRYLRDQQGNGALFGHQHTTDNGITFSEADGVSSDVLAGTGDHPAIFGWDTLILEGLEAPGIGTLEENGEENAQIWADGMKNAHALGGINTISTHMYNFATGEDFYTTTGRPVSTILPGGPKNAEFNEYLDLIALTASLTVDENGNDIPLIFRPFHENTGSWFWWGAAHATTGEYKEIFRYTVEYLRDVKGVDNLLYSFSPNGTFGGDQARYLETYPGDEYIDIIGYDFYENSNEPENSDAWISQLIPDLAMITDIAEERGKIPAFTEFGRNGDRTIKESGNKSLQYYTDILDAIKADPKASRISYMQTWSNWGLEQFYVPYPATATLPEHEMYQDFLQFYEDDYTVFADEIADDAFDRPATPAGQDATFRLVSPADGVRITTESATVRAKATAEAPNDAYFTVDDDTTRYPLVLADGYFTGEWQIGSEALVNGPATITVVAEYADGSERVASSEVILGGAPLFPVGVIDDFEGYGSDAALRAAYAFNNDAADLIALSTDVVGTGSKAVAFDYEFGPRDYAGFGKAFDGAQDWTGFNQLNAWLAPGGSNQKLVLQFDAGGQTFEAYPSLAGTEPTELAISFADFRNKADPTLFPTAAQLASVTS